MKALRKLEQLVKTEKSPKSQFYDRNTAALHSNTCRSESRSFEDLSESKIVTVCIGIFPLLLRKTAPSVEQNPSNAGVRLGEN